jgi:hypothetical protein
VNAKALEKQLKALKKLFRVTKIPYAVLGGMAVILYGEPRFTMDIDVNISLPSHKMTLFLSEAKKYGFLPSCAKPESFAKTTGVIPMRFMSVHPPGRCDIVIARNPIEFSALKRSVSKKIGMIKAKFITAEDLVIHKIASDRPRDLEDLRGILMRQKGKLDLPYIFLWLKKIDKVNAGPSLVVLLKSLLHPKKGK